MSPLSYPFLKSWPLCCRRYFFNPASWSNSSSLLLAVTLTRFANLCFLLSDLSSTSSSPAGWGGRLACRLKTRGILALDLGVCLCGLDRCRFMHPYSVFVKHDLSFFLIVCLWRECYFFSCHDFHWVQSMETAWIDLQMNRHEMFNIHLLRLFLSFFFLYAHWKIVSVETDIRFSS